MICLLIVAAICNGEPPPEDCVPMPGFDDDTIYHKIRDVWFMTFMVCFLMMFIKKFEWTTFTATLISIMWAFLTYVFVKVVCRNKEFTAQTHGEGVVCAVTMAISAGVFIGNFKLWQHILVGILFALSYSLVEWIVISGDALLGVVDPGAAITVHMFACYYGIGVAKGANDKRLLDVEQKYTIHSIGWVFLASSTLWLYWPSFVTMFYSGQHQSDGAVACVMAGLGSIVSSFIMEAICKKGILDSVVFAYALLAGCIGISSALFIVGPWGAFLIGLISGIVSVLSYNFLDPLIVKGIKFKDVMGVHSLHGMCSWVSVICGIIGACAKKFNGVWTFCGALIAFGIAIVAGLISGVILKFTMCGELAEEELLNDEVNWILPEPKPKKKSSKRKKTVKA